MGVGVGVKGGVGSGWMLKGSLTQQIRLRRVDDAEEEERERGGRGRGKAVVGW